MHGPPAISFVMVGLQTSFTIDNIALGDNATYVSVMKATNQADITSFVYSQSVYTDFSEALPGVIKDGTNWSSDLVFQSDITQVSVTFSHAIFQPAYQDIGQGQVKQKCEQHIHVVKHFAPAGIMGRFWSIHNGAKFAASPKSIIGRF